MRYYIADCHFFHEAMNDKMDHRGFASVEEMNQYMLQQWNQKVRPQDDVIILGDLSYGKPDETNALLQQLHGRLYLISGNHDRVASNPKYDQKRFVWIKDYEELKDEKRKVILCHYPIMCYNGQYRVHSDERPVSYMLYGHVHDTEDQRLIEQYIGMVRNTQVVDQNGRQRAIPCHMINCFCKYSDYVPLTLDEWIANHNARMADKENLREY